MGSVFFGCLTATFRSVPALRYGIFTILARSEMPRPFKIMICKIGRGVPHDFDIVYKKPGNMAAFSVEGKKRKKLEF